MLAITSPFWHKREGKKREIVILLLFPSYKTINGGGGGRENALFLKVPETWQGKILTDK